MCNEMIVFKSDVTYKIYLQEFDSNNQHLMTYLYITHSGFCFQSFY